MREERVGVISHYFGHLGVAAMVLESELAVGDTVHIKGHTTDLTQKIDSIQIEHESIPVAKKGEDIAIKVKNHVREHDAVFKVLVE